MATTGIAREDVVRTIHAIDREFMDAVAAKDAQRVAALYAEDARIMMPGRPAISGRSEILSFYKAAFQGLVESILLDTTDIEVSGDLAYAAGSNRITLRPPGQAPREERGKYVAVYRRGPAGDWKVVVDSYSNNE
jgi:uncharacterized protein (TIGR02246 family)